MESRRVVAPVEDLLRDRRLEAPCGTGAREDSLGRRAYLHEFLEASLADVPRERDQSPLGLGQQLFVPVVGAGLSLGGCDDYVALARVGDLGHRAPRSGHLASGDVIYFVGPEDRHDVAIAVRPRRHQVVEAVCRDGGAVFFVDESPVVNEGDPPAFKRDWRSAITSGNVLTLEVLPENTQSAIGISLTVTSTVPGGELPASVRMTVDFNSFEWNLAQCSPRPLCQGRRQCHGCFAN